MPTTNTEIDRAALKRRLYKDYSDPETGELPDPKSYEEKIVQEMTRYGDTAGVNEFMRGKKEGAYYDKAIQGAQRQASADDLDALGAEAYTLSEMYETIKKGQGEAAARSYINRVYPVKRDLMRKSGFGDYMSDEYDHETALSIGRTWAHKKGKDFGKQEEDPRDIKTFKRLYPGVDPGSPQGREQYFQFRRREKAEERAPRPSTAKTADERLADNLIKNIDREYYANKKAVENDWLINPDEKAAKLEEIETARSQAYQGAAGRIRPSAHKYFYELTGIQPGGGEAPKAQAPAKSFKVPKAKVKFLD